MKAILVLLILSLIATVLADSWSLIDGNSLLYGPAAMDSHKAVYYEASEAMVIIPGQSRGTLDPKRYFYKIDQSSWYSLPYSNVTFPRYSHTAIVYGDAVYVFGGNKNNNPLSDTIAYNITSKSWIGTLSVTGSVTARYLHVAAVINGVMYVHGGTPGSLYGTPFNDTYTFNLATKTWALVNSNGPQRYSHSVIVTPSNKLVIFGGIEAKTSTTKNDLYQFDGTSWTQITPTGSTLPPVMSGHTAVLINDGMFVFGGTYSNAGVTTYYNDIWVFNLTTNTWSMQSPTGKDAITGRAMHSAIVTSDKRMIVFGGYNSTGDVGSQLAIYESPFYVPPPATSSTTSAAASTTSGSTGNSATSSPTTGSATTGGSSTGNGGTTGSSSSTTESPVGGVGALGASLGMIIMCIAMLL